MRITILSDSNISQHVFKDDAMASKTLQAQVNIVRASTVASFKEFFTTLEDVDLLIISTLLNQVSQLDASWSGTFDEEKMKQVEELVINMAGCINQYADENKHIRIMVIPPFTRTHPLWLGEYLHEIEKFYRQALSKNVEYAPPPPVELNDLSKDGIHIKQGSANKVKTYLKQLLTQDSEKNETRKRPRESDDIDPASLSNKEILLRIYAQGEQVKALFERTQAVEEKTVCHDKKLEVIEMKLNEQLIHLARINERVDAKENKDNRNVLLIRNLRYPANFALPNAFKDKILLTSQTLCSLLKSLPPVNIKSPMVKEIYLCSFGGDNEHFQAIRMICQSEAEADEVKHRILNAKAAQHELWYETEVNNDPVKATRVRVQLLSSIARHLRENAEENVTYLVTRFSDSPALIVKENGKFKENLTFVDSILKYGHLLNTDDVSKAKNMAGNTFAGRLEQNFLVLKEIGPSRIIPTPTQSTAATGSNASPIASSSRGSWRGKSRGRGRGRGSYKPPTFTGRLSGSLNPMPSYSQIVSNNANVSHQASVAMSQVTATEPVISRNSTGFTLE